MGGCTSLNDESKRLANLHLRHAMLSAIHSHLKNYMLCMDREYFGERSPEEIELTKKLHEVMVLTEASLGRYFNLEAEIFE